MANCLEDSHRETRALTTGLIAHANSLNDLKADKDDVIETIQ